MKLVRHYLKYDLLRWCWLLPVIWLSAAGYIWTMHRIAGSLSPDFQSSWRAFRTLSNQLYAVGLLAAVTGSVLCLLAGATDSRLRAQSWTMTRPMNYRRLFSARAVLLGVGVCLPLTLAQFGSLTVMEFHSTTIQQETLRAGLLFGLAAAFIYVVGMAGRNVAVIFITTIGATLCGLFLFMPGGSTSRSSSRYHPGVFEKADVWPVVRSKGESEPESAATQHVRLSDPGASRGMTARSFRLHAFSWRASSAEPWSPWAEVNTPARDRAFTSNEEPYAWHFELYPVIEKLRSGFKNGDLRMGVALFLESDREEIIPIEDYAPSGGESWTMKAGAGQNAKGIFHAFSTIRFMRYRSAPLQELEPLYETASGFRRPRTQHSGQSGFGLPLMDIRFYTWQNITLPDQTPVAATHLRIRRSLQQNPVFKVLELTGITLPASQPATAASVPSFAASDSPRTSNWETLSQMPQPLMQGGTPGIPEAGATRAEVAAYLTYLTTTQWEYQQGPWGWSETQRRKFAALVPQWLPLFLQAAVVAGEQRGAVLESALLQGSPDERRAELIARIPESPGLARIAIQRGWLAEATPQLVALFQKAGGIPGPLDQFITEFRAPAFHPWLRAKFRATVPMIRFWQSVPELAKDLPDLLAAARQRIASVPGNPNGWGTDEINGLLSTGDAAALDLTLRSVFERHQNQTSWPDDLLRRWVRITDDQGIPFDSSPNEGKKALKEFSKGLTADDFTWNAARCLFIQKPKSSTP
jgi:hypothetical protein